MQQQDNAKIQTKNAYILKAKISTMTIYITQQQPGSTSGV